MFKIMDRSGHTEVETKGMTSDEINRKFDEIVAANHIAVAKVTDPESGKPENVQIGKGEFDPSVHEDVTFVPPFAGG